MVVNRRKIVAGSALFVVAVWANNSSLFVSNGSARPSLLAHRGVHQDFPHEGLTNEACTATRIFPPQNSFIEDTIPSMREAFKDGADVVEFDIHPTTDGQWAVFHDWTLECRTNGVGVTRKQSLAYLKTLDVGYGYTADGGKTFPFRGQGVGLMPSLDEVLNEFPDRSFLIHIKSNDPSEGAALVAKLRQLGDARRAQLMVYGANRPVAVVHAKLPAMRTMSPGMEKACLLTYEAVGWTGYVPAACRNSWLGVPINLAPLLWGWPNKFLKRMDSVGTPVFVVDDLKAGGSKGLNSAEDLRKLPKGYRGGIWTDRIELVGPRLRSLN